MKLFKNKIERVQFLLPLMVWLLLFSIPLLFNENSESITWEHIFRIWKEYLILMVLFLINRFILMPYLFFKDKRKLYFISISSIIVLLAFGLYLFRPNGMTPQMHEPQHIGRNGNLRPDINGEKERPAPRNQEGNLRPPMGREGNLQSHIGRQRELQPPINKEGNNQLPMNMGPREPIPPFANIIILGILLIGFDSGLLFFGKWMQSKQNQLSAEKENIKNKMAFLQNQVSPHFFMNTLNNIHALVDIDKEEAKEAIIKLSQMMDYMLYETQRSTSTLQQEIDFIQSYVELMKLRYTDDIDIKFEIPKTIPTVQIPPLLTISFIENAFKYGISYEKPSFIHIMMDITNNKFYFSIKNNIHSFQKKKKNSGIGIENTKHRLDLIFGKNYDLNIENKDNTTFEVKLNFPL